MPSPESWWELVRTRAQWREWKAWLAVRGPIGGPRQDFYTSMLAMYAGGPYQEKVTFDDFAMPWALQESPDPLDEED